MVKQICEIKLSTPIGLVRKPTFIVEYEEYAIQTVLDTNIEFPIWTGTEDKFLAVFIDAECLPDMQMTLDMEGICVGCRIYKIPTLKIQEDFILHNFYIVQHEIPGAEQEMYLNLGVFGKSAVNVDLENEKLIIISDSLEKICSLINISGYAVAQSDAADLSIGMW